MKTFTESEITTEAAKDNDFFAAHDRLRQRYDEAERALARLKPVSEADAAPWSVEPSNEQVLAESKTHGMTLEDARESVKRKLAADAKRLASFSAEAATEISEALAAAEDARERAENLLADHEAALSAVTNGIFSLGNIRREIAVVKSLAIDPAGEKQLAKKALDYFVDRRTTSETTANATGFRTFADDLVWRRALTEHIGEYVAPLEAQAATLIQKIRAQAAESKMDLKKVFDLLASERGQRGGEQLLHDQSFYSGII